MKKNVKTYLKHQLYHVQKVRTYGKLIKKLRYKLEVEEVQLERLEAQRAALQDNVPSHVHRRLQNQLQDITRKHNEFAAFIRGLSEFQSALPQVSDILKIYFVFYCLNFFLASPSLAFILSFPISLLLLCLYLSFCGGNFLSVSGYLFSHWLCLFLFALFFLPLCFFFLSPLPFSQDHKLIE